ncbi:MAG TPA: hypothetical protein VN836_09645 [Verrucomicrobiae bacterium]|nr:hypothetical protein [Verrucomicrobiae bacterium]
MVALRDSLGNGTFDLLDPARGFRLLSAQMLPAGVALSWASMPGYGYQVVSANALSSGWGDLPGATNFAGPLQLILSYTDAPPVGITQRYYRVKLLP